ncbi:hypothetical protein V3C99_011226, partial [Haemonchus contortus]
TGFICCFTSEVYHIPSVPAIFRCDTYVIVVMAWHNTAFYLKAVPISVLITAFLSLVAYVTWSIHIFNPVPLRINMDCSTFLGAQGRQHLEEYKLNRTILEQRIDLNVSQCWTIRKRRYLPTEVPDSMEVHHNMYFLRIVSKNYDFLEEVLTMMYSPLHFYCFVIDSSASPRFEQLVRSLGKCILNIIVPPNTYDTSTARGTLTAINACYVGMEEFPWKHTVVSAENEIPIHSVHYIADNARRLGNGARVGRVTISEEHARILSADEFFQAHPRDQEYLRRLVCTWLDDRRFPLTLPRNFQLPLFRFLGLQDLENCQPLSPDFDKNVALDVCHTNRYDHRGNCVVGMEDYEYTTKSRNLFVKADPNFDHGIVQCVHEFVYRRTYKEGCENMNQLG